jgi:hypothetical protein
MIYNYKKIVLKKLPVIEIEGNDYSEIDEKLV